MTDRLRELAERLDVLAHAVTEAQWSEFSMRVPVEPKRDADCVLSQAAIELRAYAAILDADGDGGAVGGEAMKLLIAIREDDYLSDSSRHRIDMLRNAHANPARSGVVMDEDVDYFLDAYEGRRNHPWSMAHIEKARAALEHFVKGERHER